MQTMTSLASLSELETGQSPVLIKSKEEAPDRETLQTLRRFHLAGPQGEGSNVWIEKDILPALLDSFRHPESVRTQYPVVLVPETEAAGTESEICLSLADFIQTVAPDGGATTVLGDNLLRLEQHVRERVSDSLEPVDARPVLEEAAEAMRKALSLPESGDQGLAADLTRLIDAIPDGAQLCPLTEGTPVNLFRHAAQIHVRSAGRSFKARVREVAARTRALLESDLMKRPDARDPGAVKSTMGDVGSRFLDPSRFAGVEAVQAGPPMPDDRRERLEAALAQLEDETPVGEGRLLTLIHDGSLGSEARSRLLGWQVEESEDPCSAAARRFDDAAEALAEVIRAERLARLEYENQYHPDRHGPWLAQLDWHVFSREELHLIPPILVCVSADHVARRGLPSLSRLILSGRPVHVMILDHPGENPGADDAEDGPGEFRFEPGYLGMSLREGWVQQTSAARPRHMMNGFTRAFAGTRAALHVVINGFGADGTKPRLGPWFYAGAALESRANPCFQYDPEAGNSWARRLDFAENPSPESDWPVYQLSARIDEGGEEKLSLSFTFADFALLDPVYAPHFRLVPEEIPDSELMALDAYLALDSTEAVQKLPFVWGVDGTGTLRRLCMTRRLARAARDRLGYWRTLQELAGLRNEYVLDAARRAKEEAEAVAAREREALEARHQKELDQLRNTATTDVVTQLTAALMEVDAGALAAPTLFEGLQGRGVDEVAEILLKALPPDDLEPEPADAPEGPVEQAAGKLMDLIDPDRLEENSE